MWILPRFLLDWRRDIRPHVILWSTLFDQAVEFGYKERGVIPSLKECISDDGKVWGEVKHNSLLGGLGDHEGFHSREFGKRRGRGDLCSIPKITTVLDTKCDQNCLIFSFFLIFSS